MQRYRLVEPVELAYLAGFFDGEGCISVSPVKYLGRLNYQVMVVVGQNDGRALEPFARLWGGKIGQRQRPNDRDDDSCVWSIGATRALQCIRQLLPYLRAKRAEAEIVLEWPVAEKTGRGQIIDATILSKRKDIWLKLRAIKRERKRAIPPDSQPGVEKMAREPGLLDRPHVVEALKLYVTGQTSAEVAEALGLKQGIVNYWVRQAGIARRRGVRTHRDW